MSARSPGEQERPQSMEASPAEQSAMRDKMGARFFFARLAIQNLGRRKARTFLLLSAVAICSGAVFTGAVLMQSIKNSMDIGFARLGADMLILPEGTLTNITAALLTAEPTDFTLEDGVLDRLAKLKGVGRLGPQRIVRTESLGSGDQRHPTDLIGFDPERDITIQPWLAERLDRAFGKGDVIIGGRREEPLGSEMLLFGVRHTVYGKLEKTAVGTHERGVFMSFETFDALRESMQRSSASKAELGPNRLSGVLIELAPGATAKQVQFAILANFPGVKTIASESTLTSIRQGLSALLEGVLALLVIMFVSTASMVCVLFSAIITERRRELGLLMAIGARPWQVVGILATEAAIATASGGLLGCMLGVALLRSYQHSLVYHLANMGVPFAWLGWREIALIALACVILASLIGASGAFIPAWRTSRREPYDLIRAEG